MADRHEFLVVVDGLDLTEPQRATIESAVQKAASEALIDLRIDASASPLQDEIQDQTLDEDWRRRPHPPTMGIVYRPVERR